MRSAGLVVPYNLRFPGQYYDAETGLNQNWNRDYDPVVGRYVESDPMGLTGGGPNTYAYVIDRPTMLIDSKGLWVYYGFWCGPDWTGGLREPYTPSHASIYRDPVDDLDAACMHHDICYYRCRAGFPCNKDARGKCMTKCDRVLANEYQSSPQSQGPGDIVPDVPGWLLEPLWWWMQFNKSPDPGSNAPSCPTCQK